MMRLSFTLSGFDPLAADAAIVAAADACGLDGVWCAEHVGHRDAVVRSALWLERTQELEIGLIGLSAASRHPGMTAMELASLAEAGGGRIRAAIGLGAAEMIATIGGGSRSVEAVVRYHAALTAALSGDEVTVDADDFPFDRFRLHGGPAPVAIDLMAVRPRMVRAAAEHADGVLLSARASCEYLRDTVATVTDVRERAGRSREGFRVTAAVFAYVGDDLALGAQRLAATIGQLDPSTGDHLARGVLPDGAMVAAVQREGAPGLRQLLTPEVVGGLALLSMPSELPAALRRFEDTGIDELSLVLVNDPAEVLDVTRELVAARAALSERTARGEDG